ncbi:nuclear pore complex protein Nup160-like [Xenia sp. Carnegie-2017]|uniref:nuclear pore complex protein Nup160-like n=1 Tax=Xenia sp. Carnegie-2017 TaxID=2897299 RepID=UPI001F04D0E2|nr:nuclear pore complex protein Nup160-like [Xenia sp. Carnegie-2017]
MAGEQTSIFREVVLQIEQNIAEEIEVNTGSLSNITVRTDGLTNSEAGGGFAYKYNSRVESIGRNRFIHWRTSRNVLELHEVSLDVNLQDSLMKIHFKNSSLLPNIEIFETSSSVVLLAATTNSVHRFIFPHPNKLQSHDFSLSPRVSISIPSIFSEQKLPDLYLPWNFASFSSSCNSFSAWLFPDGHCLFNMITNDGNAVVLKLPPPQSQGVVEHYELKNAGVMQRLWSGLVPSRIRGDGTLGDLVVSAQINPLDKETYVFALYQDHKIRVWKWQTQECVSMKNLIDDIPDDVDLQAITGQSHMLKKAIGSTPHHLYLGVFISLLQQGQFLIYEVVYMDGEITLVSVMNLFSPKGNLIDFVLSINQIWTLWISDEGVPFVRHALIESNQLAPTGWQHAILEDARPSEINVAEHQEPRETYLEYIFHPGRFSKYDIDKAIKIFDSSSRRPLTTVRKTHLKQQVIALVDSQVQNAANRDEVEFHEYSDLQLQMWSRFYACLVQYHEASNKPLGLFLDDASNVVMVIRKEAISFLRPCDDLTTLHWKPFCEEAITSLAEELSIDDQIDRNDAQILFQCINIVTEQLTEDHIVFIEQELSCGNDVDHLMQDIAAAMLFKLDQKKEETSEKQFLMTIEIRLQKIQNLMKIVENVLNILDVNYELDEDDFDALGDDMRSQHLNLRRLFASDLSVSLLASSYEQLCERRVCLCRDLLILLHVMTRLSSRAGLHSLGSHTISSEHVPRATYLLRVYHSLLWFATRSVLPTPPNALDNNLKQLAALEITDVSNPESFLIPEITSCPILELFLSGKGGNHMRLLLQRYLKDMGNINRGSFKITIVRALQAMTLLLWPNRANMFFAEYLVTKGQFQTLLEYCFLLDSWLTHGRSSLAFLQGQAHLVFGDYFKAYDCFVFAVHNLNDNEPLFKKILQDCVNENERATQCFVKVMRLFEQFGSSQFVLKVANAVLSVVEPKDPSLPIIWSNIFKHHLDLGHNDEAYAAITSNPDIERKRDCLHRFVVVLCERGERLQLVEYPFVDLLEEVVSIIEYHARTVDISTHQYYQLLYSFHTYRGNHRKAASAMYEYGIRLAQELPGLESLQKQAKCYLTTMNSLRLLDEKNSWIVKPLERKDQKVVEAPNMSPKRKQGDEDADEALTAMIPKRRRQVTVIEISDLEKEYMLILARLQLLQHDTDSAHVTGPPLSPTETLVLLIQTGQYDTAFSIAKAFELSLNSIFDGLAARCVKISLYTAPMDMDERMSWLKLNDRKCSGLTRDASLADQAWSLLNVYLRRFGSKQTSVYYKCVCTRLLSMGCSLPTWLINDYKVANPGELLQLFINFDLLEEATDLAMEYLNATMGHGKEYFGLEEALTANSQPVWFPYLALDQLLTALQKLDDDDHLSAMYHGLRNQVDLYLEMVKSVSEDMIELRRRKWAGRIV